MFIYFNWCIEKKNLEALDSRHNGNLVIFAKKNSSRRSLIIVLKVREISVISKTTEEVVVFIRILKVGQRNLPNYLLVLFISVRTVMLFYCLLKLHWAILFTVPFLESWENIKKISLGGAESAYVRRKKDSASLSRQLKWYTSSDLFVKLLRLCLDDGFCGGIYLGNWKWHGEQGNKFIINSTYTSFNSNHNCSCLALVGFWDGERVLASNRCMTR